MLHNRKKSQYAWSCIDRVGSVGPMSRVRLLMRPCNQPFCFYPRLLSALTWSHHSCNLTSLSYASTSRLPPSCHCLATMLPSSFALEPDSYTALGMEGLRLNLAAIKSTPPPPAARSPLGRAPALAQGMGEGLLSMLSGQASGEWSFCLSRFLIVVNARGLRGGRGGWDWGDATAMAHPYFLGSNNRKR